jgi:hypothetical protein
VTRDVRPGVYGSCVAEQNLGRGTPGSWAARPLLAVAVVVGLLATLAAVVRLPGVAPGLTGRDAAGSPAASAPPSGAGTSVEGSFDDGVRTLLAAMTDAVRQRDAARFSTLAAAEEPAVRAHLLSLGRALTALPLGSFRLALDPARAAAPARGYPAGARTLPVVASYRLAGWDAEPVVAHLLLVVAPDRRGGWAVVGDRTRQDARTDQRLEPWLFDDVEVTRTAHVLVVGDTAHTAQTRRLARTLEGLAADVRRLWPERTWNDKVVVYALTSTAFVRSWYGTTAAGDRGNGNRASFVAKVATLPPGPGGDAGAVRLVLTPYLLERPRSAVQVLRHEVTHVATAGLGNGVASWLTEGAAEYTGFARHTGDGGLDATTTLGRHGLTSAEVSATLRGTWRPTLLDAADFYAGSAGAVDEHYDSAFITCLYIADRYGEPTLRRFYERAARRGGPAALSQGAAHRPGPPRAGRRRVRDDAAPAPGLQMISVF